MDEQELIESCLRGRMEDFRMIVERYMAPAMALAMNVLGNRDDAEDACQELFIQVFRNLESYDKEKSFKNWVYTILYRRCLDHLKRRRRSCELVKKIGFETVPTITDNPGHPHPSRNLPAELLGVLKARERAALCLWANDGYTAREIGEVLGCSASTARVYLFQARKKIRKLLEQGDVSL